MQVEVTINGTVHRHDVEPRVLLVDFIRDLVGLTGTKVGCDTGQCGACHVLIDGVSVKSCAMLAVQADGSHITTIEGIASDGQLSPIQQAFWERHGLQCGFCTPGMVISLVDLLQRTPQPDEAAIRAWLDGTLCRCTGYQNVVRAAQLAAEQLASSGKA